jgi:hypothetical protein
MPCYESACLQRIYAGMASAMESESVVVGDPRWDSLGDNYSTTPVFDSTRRTNVRLILLELVVVAVLTAVNASSAAAELTSKQQATVDQLISFHSRGNSVALLKSAATLTRRAKPEQLDAINEYLHEQDGPPICELMADTRLKLVLQGQTKHLPKPTQQETLLTIPRINDIVSEAVDAVDDQAILQDPLPTYDSLDEYEKLLWDVHVLENNLRNALNIATYGDQMMTFAKRFKPDSMTAQQQAIAQTNFTEQIGALRQKTREIAERKAEVRLNRLMLAGEVLYDSTDFRLRFTAAHVVDLDGELLAEFLDAHKGGPFSRTRLKEPDLANTIADEVALLRTEAGDLIAKSRLFYTGLHWWQRGRYGRGSEGNGMLKSAQATKSAAAAFGLFMPTETPIPTDPYETGRYQVPQVDRRHHYAWMYEYRQIERHRRTDTSKKQSVTSVTKLSHFY